MFQHTAARRRLADKLTTVERGVVFQHTAARRRLDTIPHFSDDTLSVSTHSRPKAAGYHYQTTKLIHEFQHTAARRRLGAFNL